MSAALEKAFIPAAVKAGAARADELHRAAYTPPEANPAAQPDATGTTPEAPAAAAPASHQPVPGFNTPAPTTPAATSEGNADENDLSWKQKFDSVNGRYTAREQTIRQLSGELDALRLENAELRATRTVTVTPTAPAFGSGERYVTEEEETEYGKDFLDVASRKAKEVFSPELAAMRNELAQMKETVAGVQGYVQDTSKIRSNEAYASSRGFLDAQLPNWRDINKHPTFIAWLGLPDPMSGDTRMNLLKAADGRNDGPRMLAIFHGFLRDEAPELLNQPENKGGQTVPQIPLSSLAAPGKAKTAAQSAPTEKPSYTSAQISQFYADKRHGKYRGKEAEADAIERSMVEAGNEGRIIR